MLNKILLNFSLIIFLSLSGCEDFYNFEANKLKKKATTYIEKSKISNNTNEKIELLSNALINLEKIQNKYPKTKIARIYRKSNEIPKLSAHVDQLRILSSKQKLEKEKETNIGKLKKNIDLASLEIKNKNKLQGSIHILNAIEISINQIGDSRTKSRLSNEISRQRVILNDKENAYRNLLESEKFIDEMYTDLPKKIKNLSQIYKLLHLLEKKNKKNEIEKKIYSIINNEIKNNDNKAVAYLEITKINLIIGEINKVKEDMKKIVKLAEKSNTYLDIAKIYSKINDVDQLNYFLDKAKKTAKSKDQIFWIVRDLINISLFENSINLSEQSYSTLIEAKQTLPDRPDERLVLELVDAFAKINQVSYAEELISLIKPKYEESMAYVFIGRQLAKKQRVEEMKVYIDKAIKIAPDLIHGNYEFSGLPGFSTKGRIFAEIARAYANIGDFKKSHELLGLIESDRFYKEGMSDVIIIQALKDKSGASKLASKMMKLGGEIVDNKFLGKIAYAQAISGQLESALITVKKMNVGVDLSETLINITNHINLQQEDLLTLYH